MIKSYPPMKCCICNRPLLRAVALKGGRPVGPVCAVTAGLVAPKPPARTTPRDGAQNIDTHTMDLFATT